jgi:hypothetical protein
VGERRAEGVGLERQRPHPDLVEECALCVKVEVLASCLGGATDQVGNDDGV